MEGQEFARRLREQTGPPVSTARKRAYSLTNPYTTEHEKVEIETWYQLPVDLAGITYIVTCVLWARGAIGGWQAYLIALGVGVVAAIALWIAYPKRVAFLLKVLIGCPVLWLWILPHAGFAAWLAFTGAWTQAAFLTGNCLLLKIPVGLGAVITNQVLASQYRMHPKYAFLKHTYGKVYPFE